MVRLPQKSFGPFMEHGNEHGIVAASSLRVYLLGTFDFDTVLNFQRRLHYEVTGDRSTAALILCEHPPIITIGREGSSAHILCSCDELQARQLEVRWVNRGGGCYLHGAGQLAAYPILPIDRFKLHVPDYLNRLERIVLRILKSLSLAGTTHANRPGVWLGFRPVANIGIALHEWVTYFGIHVNVNPELEPFALVRTDSFEEQTMTSLERERRIPVSPSMIRQQFIEHFLDHFPFNDVAIFTDHPDLKKLAQR